MVNFWSCRFKSSSLFDTAGQQQFISVVKNGCEALSLLEPLPSICKSPHLHGQLLWGSHNDRRSTLTGHIPAFFLTSYQSHTLGQDTLCCPIKSLISQYSNSKSLKNEVIRIAVIEIEVTEIKVIEIKVIEIEVIGIKFIEIEVIEIKVIVTKVIEIKASKSKSSKLKSSKLKS